MVFIQLEEVPKDSKDGPPDSKTGPEAPTVKIPKEADFLIYTCDKNNGTPHYLLLGQCLILIISSHPTPFFLSPLMAKASSLS